MKKSGTIAFGIALALASARPVGADDGAKDLVKKLIDAAPKDASQGKGSLTSSRGGTRELNVYRKNVGGTDSVYMEVTAPGDVAGTRFLMKDKTEGPDEQYIYIPAVKRVIKVSEETRKQPFLGSDFFILDLVKPDIDAYDYSFVGEETINGRKTKLVQAMPKKPEGEIYSKTITAIDPQDLVLVRTQYFDKKGQPYKVLTAKKLEQIDGTWWPTEQEMADLQSSSNSVLVIKELKTKVDLPDGMFDRGYMAQERGG